MVIHLAGSPCPVGGSVTVLAPFILECAGVVQLSVSTGCGCYPNVCSLILSILSVRPSCHVGGGVCGLTAALPLGLSWPVRFSVSTESVSHLAVKLNVVSPHGGIVICLAV